VNDQELLAAYLQGDEGALEALVQNYYRLVVATATRATGDLHLAQDIAQTVFLIFTRKARRLRKEVSLPGWFIRTAQFTSRDALKKLTRRSFYEAASSSEPDDGAQRYEVTGAALLLTEAILALSPKEQVCVLARFYDERPTADIARDHSISEDAVQKRIERGLEKMRSFFVRRGFRIAASVLPGLFVAAFPRGAEAQGIQVVLSGLHAAKAAGTATVGQIHGSQLLKEISRRKLFSIGLKSGAGLLVLGTGVGGFVAFHEPAVPSLPPFRSSGPQVEALGKAWAQVVRQVAALVANRQAAQQAGNTASTVIVTDTVRISSELAALQTPGRERTVMAEFLTIELRETLGLSERQQAYVYGLFHDQLANGDSPMAAYKVTFAAKPALVQGIRTHLSLLQRRRFDYTYGKDALGFLAFLGALAAG
jgi:RNA polymerase sigma-70 factor (ECF subfamily)